ncbi:MAG TPA: glycosyltransferase [Candidatus Andersenbacteria bacterium]|nr:glycosyltransferase [Candidatus Andersenbacteria bacterium]
MRICIIHDYLTHMGGGEHVLEALAEAFPSAPVYTLVYDQNQVHVSFDNSRIRTSFLQKFPGAARAHRYFPLALMPLAIEQFNLSQFDVIISNAHSFGKGVLVSPGTLHISYCMTPTRYAWDDSHRYVREFSGSRWFQKFAPFAISYIRMWDFLASQRVDAYVTLSRYVSRRIQKYYNRSSHVIYPPVDIGKFSSTANEGQYYLVVSRLVPYKRIEIAIAAAENLGKRLKIAGTGPELAALQRIAGPMTEFLGFVPDALLPELYRNAKALLFPQEEDFGLTPIEAAASGVPTIAYGAGGALETIIDGTTGLFFPEQATWSLMQAMQVFEGKTWNKQVLVAHAAQFSKQRFMAEIQQFVQKAYARA